MRNWILFLVGVILIGLLGYGCLYQYFGLKEYKEARSRINLLDGEQKENALKIFDGEDEKRFYGGIVAGVTKKILPGVWVWGKRGLKYFRTDNYSVYSLHLGCAESVKQNFVETGQMTVARSITTDLNKFSNYTIPGRYISVLTAVEENGGTLGNLREAGIFDWWVFVPNDLNEICKR